MKRLTLLRHAKAGTDAPGIRDFDRGLNGKGHRAARLVGQSMRANGLEFDRVIASPAVRVVQTLEDVATGTGRALAPEWEKRIYLASAVTLLDVIQETPAGVESLLLAGHNPGLEDLVLMLVPDGAEGRDAVEQKYPTASVAELAFEGEWADLKSGAARLTRFTRPRDLDPSLGPEFD